jgi:outer membrane protein
MPTAPKFPLRHPLAVIAMASVATVAAAIGPARADTLSDALSDAYTGNAALAAQRFTLRQTDEQVPQALSGWRPTVEVQGQVERSKQFLNFGGGPVPHDEQVFNQTQGQIQITQPLYRGGSTKAGVAAAEATVAAGEAELTASEQDQLLAAATAYLDAYRDQSDVSLSRNLERVLRVNERNVTSTYKAGAATETDTSQAAARLSGAIASLLASEGNLASSVAAFRTAVGRDPAGTLGRPAVIGTVPDTEPEAESLAVTDNPTVRAARRRIEAAKHQVDALTGHLLPQVNAIAGYQVVDNYLVKGVRLSSASVGVQASVPLYEAGSTYSQIRAAREAAAASERDALQSEREARQQVASAWNQLQTARAQQQQYRDQIHANQVALDDTMKEVEVGTRTRLDTLNAEQELFSSQVNLVGAEHDTLLATFRLEAAIGGFTAESLGLKVERYDPKAHLAAVRDQWIGTTPRQ